MPHPATLLVEVRTPCRSMATGSYFTTGSV
jgi:hypothetical protein